MGAHLVNGQFQSDKYPTCPAGKVPLSVKDPTAQDLLWEYAQRRRAVDAEFSDDLETALRAAGYIPPEALSKAEGRVTITVAYTTEPTTLRDGWAVMNASNVAVANGGKLVRISGFDMKEALLKGMLHSAPSVVRCQRCPYFATGGMHKEGEICPNACGGVLVAKRDLDPLPGARVQTADPLTASNTFSRWTKPRRRAGTRGVVLAHRAAFYAREEDCWFVRHDDDGTEAPYDRDELTVIEPAAKTGATNTDAERIRGCINKLAEDHAASIDLLLSEATAIAGMQATTEMKRAAFRGSLALVNARRRALNGPVEWIAGNLMRQIVTRLRTVSEVDMAWIILKRYRPVAIEALRADLLKMLVGVLRAQFDVSDRTPARDDRTVDAVSAGLPTLTPEEDREAYNFGKATGIGYAAGKEAIAESKAKRAVQPTAAEAEAICNIVRRYGRAEMGLVIRAMVIENIGDPFTRREMVDVMRARGDICCDADGWLSLPG